MKLIILLLSILLFSNGFSLAEELSVVGDLPIVNKEIDAVKETQEPTLQPMAISPEQIGTEEQLNNMKSSIEAERKKQNEINLLEKDIKKYNLELEKKQLIEKLNNVSTRTGQSTSVVSAPATQNTQNPEQNTPLPAINVSYISLSEKLKETLVTIDGTKILAQEGNNLAAGYLLKSINKDNILMQNQAGQEITVNFNPVGQ